MKEILPIVMNTSFERLALIDDYISLIWTTRYYVCGDFELVVDVSETNVSLFQQGYYIVRDDDENVGIIEKVHIEKTEDNQEIFIVTGRFLASIIGRRIIAEQTSVSGTIASCINTLLNNEIINPSMSARKIANFILGSYSTSRTMQAQYTGDNLLDTVSEICKAYGLGFKVTLNDSNQFVFELFEGTDRSYSQFENPYIVFSDEYDNLLSSQYEEDYQDIITNVLVAGEGEGLDRRTMWVSSAYFPSGNNILSNSDVSAYNLSAYNYSNGVYTGTSVNNYGGLQITTNGLLTVGQVYIVKYKIQKTGGKLVNIGGHNSGFEQISFTVDGNDAGYYQRGYTMNDDSDVHEVVYIGRYDASNSNSNFYIQPNRGVTTSISFKITDLEVYATQGVAGINRYEYYKDQRNLQSNNGEISDAEYNSMMYESGKESLTTITTAFTGTVYFGNLQWKQDVNIGDICVIENKRWGIYINSRLVEVIESMNEAGEYSIVPTFGI